MMDAETIRFIRKEVARQVNIILAGLSANSTGPVEDVTSLYPGNPPIPQRPVMHPYGFVSSSPDNTTQVTARVGDHPGNRMILGHRDAARPAVNKGEVQLYNQFGQAIYLADGEIHIGTAAANDPVPLGNELISFLQDFLQAYENHTHIGNLGFETPLSPSDVEAAQNLNENNLENKAIVSSYIFVDNGGG